MLSQWERWVFIYDLTLKMYPDIAPSVPLEPLIQELQKRVVSGEAVDRIENGKKVLRIRDMSVDLAHRTASLLFNYADPDVPNTVYEDLTTGTQREVVKEENEGGSYCAHMMIALDPIREGGTSYLAVLEDIPGVGRTKIEPFMTKQFKVIADAAPHEYTFTDPNRQEHRFRPIAKIDGSMSQRLRDDLERGEVKGFELVQTRPAQVDYDEFGYTKEVTRTLRLTVKQSLGERALEVIGAVTRRAKQDNFDGVKIRFKRAEGTDRTISVAAGREDVGDVLYTRYEMIDGFIEPMKQATDTLRADMLKKMLALMEEMRKQSSTETTALEEEVAPARAGATG
ncbi:hypothetical protein MTBLM5_140007 [Magnetospirillum sp. LM-5]|uniref:hypothetical protein n=1 Tax=Magnetospirillum sp. LM-5 TaxID=2681466 RepID=UPI00137C9DBD|nr:hypothetical protein [Magnetospirillum sp. LM-5]CAA7614670.1 hypothetical protein MTBLM5_140007 [Magnetospirillum sp. LM-5]